MRSSEPTGNLRVSAPHAFGMDQLVPAIPAFIATYPKLCMHFSLSDSNVNLIERQFRCRGPHGPPARLVAAQQKALRPSTHRRGFAGLNRSARPAGDAAGPRQARVSHMGIAARASEPVAVHRQRPARTRGGSRQLSQHRRHHALPAMRGRSRHHAARRTSGLACDSPWRSRVAPALIRSEGRYRDSCRGSSRAASGAAHPRFHRLFRGGFSRAAVAQGSLLYELSFTFEQVFL